MSMLSAERCIACRRGSPRMTEVVRDAVEWFVANGYAPRPPASDTSVNGHAASIR
jgi:hypothetical protein